MASMIFHGYNQIQKTGKVKLFKSHKAEFKDGEQLRDFIYVEDVCKVCFWFLERGDSFLQGVASSLLKREDALKREDSFLKAVFSEPTSGLYNLGTGKARSFNDLMKATFAAMGKKPDITYIDMPEDIRDKYQYFTEADMTKLRNAGYTESFYSLEEGVSEYVKKYLMMKEFY
jgi:ADP-L-glycero-D-manno-heptose 6-epimerase